MRTVARLARQDVAAAVRSRRYWLLVGIVFGLPVALGFLFIADVESGPEPLSTAEKVGLFLDVLPGWFDVIVPFVSIALGYRAVAGERQAGTLQVLFGMATTRRDVLAGKLLGRSLVLVASLLAGFAAVGTLLAATYGLVEVELFALTVGTIVGYALAWLWVAVGVSAAVSTRYRALTALFGLVLSFVFLWREIAIRLLSLTFEGDPKIASLDDMRQASEPAWYVYGNRLNPEVAIRGLRTHLEYALLDGRYEAGGTDPNLFGVAVLVGWGVVAVAVGYWRFRGADLAGAPSGGVEAHVDAALAWLGDGVSGLTGGSGAATVDGSADAAAAGGVTGSSATTTIDTDARATATRRRPPLGLPALSIAKKDFADAVRSKLLWSLAAFFFTIIALQNYFNAATESTQVRAFVSTSQTMLIVVPFVALVVGYRAVVGERESGTLKLLLGAPVTRRDVAVGKYLGRLAVTLAVLGSGLLVVGGFYLWQFDHLTVDRLAVTTVVVLVYAAAWLGIALGVSALSRSGTMSAATIFGAFVFFTGLWDAFVVRTLVILTGASEEITFADVGSVTDPTWFVYFTRLNPAKSYQALNGYVYHVVTGSPELPDGLLLPNLFGLAVLAAWATLPLVVGYWRLSRHDVE